MNKLTVIFLLSTYFLMSCSSGSSNPPANDIILSGAVVDGYLSDATVCLDLNDDGYCQSVSEPIAQTDKYGNYELVVKEIHQTNANFDTALLIAFNGEDVSTDLRYPSKMSTQNKGSVINITPSTTLVAFVAKRLIQSGSTEQEALTKASKLVAELLGNDVSIIEENPLALKQKDFIAKNLALNAVVQLIVHELNQILQTLKTSSTSTTTTDGQRVSDVLGDFIYKLLASFLVDGTTTIGGLIDKIKPTLVKQVGQTKADEIIAHAKTIATTVQDGVNGLSSIDEDSLKEFSKKASGASRNGGVIEDSCIAIDMLHGLDVDLTTAEKDAMTANCPTTDANFDMAENSDTLNIPEAVKEKAKDASHNMDTYTITTDLRGGANSIEFTSGVHGYLIGLSDNAEPTKEYCILEQSLESSNLDRIKLVGKSSDSADCSRYTPDITSAIQLSPDRLTLSVLEGRFQSVIKEQIDLSGKRILVNRGFNTQIYVTMPDGASITTFETVNPALSKGEYSTDINITEETSISTLITKSTFGATGVVKIPMLGVAEIYFAAGTSPTATSGEVVLHDGTTVATFTSDGTTLYILPNVINQKVFLSTSAGDNGISRPYFEDKRLVPPVPLSAGQFRPANTLSWSILYNKIAIDAIDAVDCSTANKNCL